MDATTAIVRLLVAALLTAVIGVEREFRSKPAGLRTNVVVGLAAAAYAYVGATAFSGPATDTSRVASQVVSGIGFLGAGAIFAAGGRPRGLTTAAALWVSAAIGVAAGVGAYVVAGGLVVVSFLVLSPLDLLVAKLGDSWRRQVTLTVVIGRAEDLGTVRRAVDDTGMAVVRFELRDAIRGSPVVEITVAGRTAQVDDLEETLDGVASTHVVSRE